MKPFNLERALAGDPVVTRDGRKVCVGRYPLCMTINAVKHYFTPSGSHLDDDYDLFMAEKKSETWVNVYRHKKGYFHLSPCYPYEALALAEIIAMFDSEYVKTIKIEV